MLHTRCCGCACSTSKPAIPVCIALPIQKLRVSRPLAFDPLRKHERISRGSKGVTAAAAAENDESMLDSSALPENFCIIESRESVKNFANMQLDELRENIQARRNKIFLLMEEVRRLRIQQRVKGDIKGAAADDVPEEAYPSFIPFFPPVTEKTIQLYKNFYVLSVVGIILFGGLISPSLELRLGLGGVSYYEFITGMHLPQQLAEVDPIVASFCGGAVGVLTSLLIVEANNSKMQAKQRCIYCQGTGYLTCGNCLGVGIVAAEGAAAAANGASCTCSFCSGTGKVMCTACLCTGKQLASEHDPRFDPF